ncbi:unnamed protein product [Schistosoma curassoni]|uniref:SKICH domain-containing protein n=1 Tax=Schistosoma curassoni TaxID=6186 RepID=A0A183JHG7_9TREM|nr:unnamed protein product [Schistosoma curassoni]
MDSNPIVPETQNASTDVSSSQKDSLFNVHGTVTVTTHETENKSCSMLNAAAPNEAHHSSIEVPDKSSYRDSFVLPENMSYASNNNQEPGALLLDADYHGDPLSTSYVPHKLGHNISKESNFYHLISSVFQPHHSVTFSQFSAPCDKYVLNKFKLTVTWAYEDPTQFRWEG